MDVAPKSKLESGNSLIGFDKTARMKNRKKTEMEKEDKLFSHSNRKVILKEKYSLVVVKIVKIKIRKP